MCSRVCIWLGTLRNPIHVSTEMCFFQYKAKSRKYRGMFEVPSPEKIKLTSGKGLVSTSRTHVRHIWDRSGLRRSDIPQSACHTCRKCSMETSHNLVKGQVRQ